MGCGAVILGLGERWRGVTFRCKTGCMRGTKAELDKVTAWDTAEPDELLDWKGRKVRGSLSKSVSSPEMKPWVLGNRLQVKSNCILMSVPVRKLQKEEKNALP